MVTSRFASPRAIAVSTAALVLAALAAFLVLGGSDGDDDVGVLSPTTSATIPATPTTGTPSTADADSLRLDETCTSPEGWTISYPAGWSTELAFEGWQCGLFDPTPFTIDPDSEVPDVEVMVTSAAFTFDDSLTQYLDPEYAEVVSSRDLVIDGRRAVALDTVQRQEIGSQPAGTRRFAVLVEWGDRTLFVSTDSASADDYDRDTELVLAMATTVSLG